MEKAIKQRLLGGLVLIAGAVLFLPVLLDGSGAALTIPPPPPPPAVAPVEAVAPLLDAKVVAAGQAVAEAHAGATFAPDAPTTGAATPDAAAPTAAAGEEVAPDAAALAAAPAEKPLRPEAAKAAPSGQPAAKAAPRPAPVAAPVPAKPADKAPSLPEAWVVQVASLSSREKAEALVQQLRAKHYPAVLRPQGGAWKVMVGPELSREVAESTKARLAADPQLHLSGWVQAYKP